MVGLYLSTRRVHRNRQPGLAEGVMSLNGKAVQVRELSGIPFYWRHPSRGCGCGLGIVWIPRTADVHVHLGTGDKAPRIHDLSTLPMMAWGLRPWSGLNCYEDLHYTNRAA